AQAARSRGTRPARLPDDRVRVPGLDVRRHGRGDLGGLRLGQLLELGSHRDLGLYHLGGVRVLPARPGDRGMAGSAGDGHPADRVLLPAVQRARGEPDHPWTALLRRPALTVAWRLRAE